MTTKANPKSHQQQSFVDREQAPTQAVVNLGQQRKTELESEHQDVAPSRQIPLTEKSRRKKWKAMQISPTKGSAFYLHWNGSSVAGIFFSPAPIFYIPSIFYSCLVWAHVSQQSRPSRSPFHLCCSTPWTHGTTDHRRGITGMKRSWGRVHKQR